MKLIGWGILLIGTIALLFPMYYIFIYNYLSELEEDILSFKAEIIEETNSRWDLLQGLVSITYEKPNTEERVLSKLIERHQILTDSSSLTDIKEADKHYIETLNQYLTVIGVNTKEKKSEEFNETIRNINLSDSHLVKLKEKYNHAVNTQHDKLTKRKILNIAKIAGFTKHEKI